jgi:hypothetical protein
MSWYAIRTIYHFGIKPNDINIFEERVVVFEGASWDEVMAKASAEADSYTSETGFPHHPDQSGYEQDGDALIDGYEVWSALFESSLSLSEFCAARYKAFEYVPPLGNPG